jgi:hypothetical protein
VGEKIGYEQKKNANDRVNNENDTGSKGQISGFKVQAAARKILIVDQADLYKRVLCFKLEAMTHGCQ